MNDKLRLVEIKKGSKWIIVRMDQVVRGDTFRLTEPDGEPFKIGRRRNFVALDDAYKDEAHGWGIPVEAK